MDGGDASLQTAGMRAVALNGIRRRARGVSLALVLALVLPMLLALVPRAALSAEAELARDVAVSLCTAAGKADRGTPAVHHDQEACCILCVTGLPPVGEGRLLGGLDIAPPVDPGVVRHADAAAPPVPFALFESDISLRGPPVLS
jgi:hypothetical protein